MNNNVLTADLSDEVKLGIGSDEAPAQTNDIHLGQGQYMPPDIQSYGQNNDF